MAGGVAHVRCGSSFAMSMVTDRVAVAPVWSGGPRVTGYWPGTAGVQVMVPATGLPGVLASDAPAGRPSALRVTTSVVFGSPALTGMVTGVPTEPLRWVPSAGVVPVKAGGALVVAADPRSRKSTAVLRA